ncbi:hypothetical protein FHS43_006163 [Streptosporangium becharense]|uniref:NlpC/P60 domain-containing protein n=1 Tax=Streptosporangium becharense TaxID=1816182 RepID=A0A7W9IGN9_9ACTN|nr:NlpC/P60 family protein [Streptosporangium becharense]MBB2914851.1 hypothetical protein [Streptosporangium becharense]MBB5820338.1 hypothetical protein [Streptosporangium becharense]
MATIRNLLIRLGVDFSERGIKKAERAVARFEKRLVGVSGLAAKGAGLASLAGAATSLGVALAPATAAVVALPAALAAVKVATGVAKVGLVGMGDAMSAVAEGDAKKLAEAMKKLSPNARAFVKETGGLKKAFDPVQQAVQNRLFEGLAAPMGKVGRGLLPTVRKGMLGVSGALNGMAKEALKTAKSPMFKKDLGKVFTGTTGIVKTLTGAVGPLLTIVLKLATAGMPLVKRMAEWAVSGAKAGAAFLKSKEGAAQMAGWATKAGNTLAQLGRIGKNLAGFLGGIFKSAKGSGDGVLTTIEQITARMAAFSQSVGGQARMTEAFRLLLEILRAVVGVLPIFLGPLGAVLKIMTALPGPVRGVAVQLLAFSVVAVALGGKLSFLFKTITTVSTGAIAAGGAMVKFGSGLIRGGAALGENASAAARAGAAVRSFGGAVSRGVMTSASMVTNLSALAWEKGKVAAQAAIATTRTVAMTVAQKAAAVASRALAMATRLVNAAMRANPIGIVITLLTAIGAALVLAYKKSSTFRAIVDGALRAVAAAGRWMWNTVLQPIFSTLARVITVTVPNAFKAGVAAIGRFWGKIQEVARKPVAFVVNTVYNQGIRRVWNWVASKVGLGQLDEIKGFAAGGILPGYSSRDDRLIMARSGEGILVPEFVRALGADFIHRGNAAARRGGPKAVAKELGIAGDPGGLGIPGFERGGIVGAIGGFFAKAKNWFVEGFMNAARAALNPLITGTASAVGGTGIGQLMTGVVRSLVGGALKAFVPVQGQIGGPGRRAVAAARSQIGVPYSWGGGGPGGPGYGFAQGAGIRGFDCSSLMQYAWHKATGRVIPRTTYAQIPWVKRVPKPVPGALGFPHSGHVFMATERGTIVEAPYTGARVRETGMRSAWWGMPPWQFDDGGVLPPGMTPVYNGTRRPEYVFTQRQMRAIGGNHYTINVRVAATANRAEIGREIVAAIKEFERGSGASWRKP